MARRSRSSDPSNARPSTSAETKTIPPPSATRTLADAPSTIPPPSLSARVVENAILGAAMKVFAKRGFAATRVEDVLDEAGIARGTFYRYFTSKEDVVAAAYELATCELVRAYAHEASSTTDPLDALRVGVDLYIDFHLENAALLRVLIEQSVRSDSPIAGHRRRLRARMSSTLSRAAAARGVDPLNPFLALALVSALEGVTLELLEGAPSADDVDRAKRAVHALLKSTLG